MRIKNALLILLGISVLAVTALWHLGTRVQAQARLQRPAARAAAPVPELPSANLYSPEEVRRELRLLQITPYDDPRFAFEVLAPAGWRTVDLSVTEDQLARDRDAAVPMAVIAPGEAEGAGVTGSIPVLEVAYLRAFPEEALAGVLERHLRPLGGEVLARQRAVFNGRSVEEVLLRAARPPHGTVLSRVTASRAGDLVFFVSGTAAEADYGRLRRPLGAAAVSFRPTGAAAAPPGRGS